MIYTTSDTENAKILPSYYSTFHRKIGRNGIRLPPFIAASLAVRNKGRDYLSAIGYRGLFGENHFKFIACYDTNSDTEFFAEEDQQDLGALLIHKNFIRLRKKTKEFIGLEDKAVLLGAIDHIEIWPPELFQKLNHPELYKKFDGYIKSILNA